MQMLGVRNISISRFVAMGIVYLLAAWPMAKHAWAAKPNETNAGIEDLLYQAREEAVGLDTDAQDLEALLHSDVTWEGHADELVRVGDHVNRLAAIVEKLQSDRVDAAPWQQASIDRVLPMLREIADNTNKAIEYLGRNKSRPLTGDYATWLRANAESARELADLINDTIKYGETKDRLDRLAMALSFPQK